MADIKNINEFLNPPAKYRGAPFWAWNTKIDEECIKKQIPIFKEMGFGGYHIHVRVGMDTVYMDEEYMNFVKECERIGKENDLRTYLYDEDRWPSGFAGGQVTENPAYRMQHLLFTRKPYSGNTVMRDPNLKANFAVAVRSENGTLCACYDIVLDDQGKLISGRRIQEEDEAVGVKWYAYVETNPIHSWYNETTYVDVLNKDAIDCFIENTHEKYKDYLGDAFGKTVPSIFTDEPHILYKTNLQNPQDDTDLFMPWTISLPERFLQETGTEVWDSLPELFWEKADNSCSFARYSYHKLVADLFEEAFAQNIGNWCHDNGLDFTGHYLFEENLSLQNRSDGDILRMYKHMDIPGMDLLFDMVALTTGKQIQSVVRQFGKKGAMSEEYGVTNWGFDFRNYKFQGDWQAALGITLRVPHLSMMTIEGEAKRDFPASIFYQAPWYREFKLLEDHFARINVALESGKSHVRLGVIHPIESYWLRYGPDSQTGNMREELDENFENLIQWLLKNGIDFDYISEGLLARQEQKEGYPLRMGEMEYTCIIIPGCITLRSTTWFVLEKFAQNGGKIINLGEYPVALDGKKSAVFSKKIIGAAERIPFSKRAVLEKLQDYQEVRIVYSDGRKCESYIHQMKWFDEYAVVFLAPIIKPENKDISIAQNINIIIKGKWNPTLLDTMQGTTKSIAAQYESDYTIIPYTVYGYDTLLISLEKGEVAGEHIDDNKISWTSVSVPEETAYEIEEENVCVLDMPSVWLDGELFSEREEILKVDNQLREKLDLPLRSSSMVQPYTYHKEQPIHKVMLQYIISSSINSDCVSLALEQREIARIYWNGERISNNKSGWYIDEKIEKLTLGSLRKGENILEIEYDFGISTNLEAVYLLGSFGVSVCGSCVTITDKPEKLKFSSVTEQNMPFYGGNIRYKMRVDCPNGKLKLKVSQYRGAMIAVYIDGKRTGNIILPPYELEIHNLSIGEHLIELHLYGNRFNTFSHFHCTDPTQVNASFPYLWRTQGDDWTYEYRVEQFGIIKEPEMFI